MIRRIARPGIWSDARGASIVEFALVAPVLILFVFGIIESARAIWTFQSLQETAFNSARCMAIGRSPCDSVVNVKSHAVARAAKSQITVPASAITVEASVTCHGVSGQDRVKIAMPYQTILSGFLPMSLTNLTVTACAPIPPAS